MLEDAATAEEVEVKATTTTPNSEDNIEGSLDDKLINQVLVSNYNKFAKSQSGR